MKEKFYTYIKNLQNKITDRIEEIDQLEKFKEVKKRIDLEITNETNL